MEGNRRQPIALYAWFLCGLLGYCAPAAAAPYLFDDSGYLGEAALMPGWQQTLARQAEQSRQLTACIDDETTCSADQNRLKPLAHLIRKAHSLSEQRQISVVNHYVNRKRYRRDRVRTVAVHPDSEPLKYRSRWSTAAEFIERGGDCEDYASTKYFLLRTLGLPAARMRVVIAFDRAARRHHAVLAVELASGNIWLLDTDNIIRNQNRHDYQFVYSLNEVSIWDHESTGSGDLIARPRADERAPPATDYPPLTFHHWFSTTDKEQS
ncbi:MAG: transglutaminase-like cysteine peptidase [Pseudomonadales bacterium]|nr:transglutaminase-like cysteine peptidase [Pseudomonadales bacterium]